MIAGMKATALRGLLALVLALLLGASPASATKRIALTFDDVPRGADGFLTVEDRSRMLIEGLSRAGVVQAAFFLNPANVAEHDDAEERIAAYVAAGHVIGNHTASHPRLSDTAIEDYIADLDEAAAWLAGREGYRPWFRFPYLDEGRDDLDKRDAMRAALAERGLRNAYVTVNGSDWFYADAATKALRNGEAVDRDALRDLYIEVHVGAANFYEDLAVRALGRSPAHVMLLHENDLAALWVEDLVVALKADGWEIISADEAFADPLAQEASRYDTPSADGNLIGSVAWERGLAPPLWYEANRTKLAEEAFRTRVLGLPAIEED